jgi:hypothetical protein
MLNTKTNLSVLVAGTPTAMLSHNAFGSKAKKSKQLDFLTLFTHTTP